MKLTLTVQGVEAIKRKLGSDAIYRDAIVDVLEFGRQEGERQAAKRVPRGATGQLAASIGSEMHAAGHPMYAIIYSHGATSHGGFRYGFALDASKRYHYQAGAFTGRGSKRAGLNKGGKPTAKWFTGILSLVRSAMKRQERAAAKAIERAWSR